MTVVSNTSPLNYLVLIGEAETFAKLYSNLHVPTAVVSELQALEAPLVVRRWIASPPAWLQIHSVTPRPLPVSGEIHAGERDAILLARELNADFLVMDELDGRAVARACGLTVVGTLGLLELAADRDALDFRDAVRRLRATNFHASPKLLDEFLQRDQLRSKKRGT
jgi:predicted nucleic acid-binding protein